MTDGDRRMADSDIDREYRRVHKTLSISLSVSRKLIKILYIRNFSQIFKMNFSKLFKSTNIIIYYVIGNRRSGCRCRNLKSSCNLIINHMYLKKILGSLITILVFFIYLTINWYKISTWSYWIEKWKDRIRNY